MTKLQCVLVGLLGFLAWGVVAQEGQEDVIQPLKPIVRVSPVLPKGMNAKNMEQGYVVVQFEVNEQGGVENPYVVESKPAKVYDREAIRAILKFKFAPQMVNGKPVRATARQTFEFEGKRDRQFDAGVDLSQYAADQFNFKLQMFEKDFVHKSSLVVTDLAINQVIKKQAMPDSKADWPMLSSDPGSPYLFYYHSTSRKKAKIKVYQRSDLKLLHDIDVELQSVTKSGEKKWATFKHLNGHQLLAVVGKSKPKLVVVDALKGTVEEKFTFQKNTYVLLSDDKKYVWGRQISIVPRIFEETELHILETEGFHLLKTIPIRTPLESTYYYDDILELTYFYESKEQYRRMLLRLTDQEYLADIITTKEAGFVRELGPDKARIFIGMDESRRYLKLAQYAKGVFTELSNQEFEIDYNLVQVHRDGLDSTLLFYGKNKFFQYGVFNPAKSVAVDVPFDVAGGYFKGDQSKVFLTEKGGSDIALVDLQAGELVATEKTNMGGLRIGQYQDILKTISVDVPPSYRSITGQKGFEDSSNMLFLANGENRLFALRFQSSYVTSFAADDLSDEQTVDTDKQTFQLVQKAHDPDAPVLAIGIKQITLLNPHNGQVIKQFEYDSPIGITQHDELMYWQDKKQQMISLALLAKGDQ